MTKKKIERLSVIHRREINWLKWYFLRDKKNPKRTILEQKIIVSHIKNDSLEAKFLTNLKKSTEDFIRATYTELLENAILDKEP